MQHKVNVKNILFSIIVIAAIAAMGITMLKGEGRNNSESEPVPGGNELSEEELASLDEEEREEQVSLEEERKEYIDAWYVAEQNPERHIGEYPGCPTSREYNADFIVHDEYSFRQIYSYTEMEFLGYEELTDLSEYFEGVSWDGDKIADYEEKGFTTWHDEYVTDGYINKDGTLNTITREMKFRGGEEVITEELEVVAVKLKIRYKNLSAKNNQIWFGQIHGYEDLIFMDDGKLYDRSSLYEYDITYSPDYSEPIYSTMREKFAVICGETATFVIELEPNEEYVGEVIYLFFKEDMDNIYFSMDSGLTGNDMEWNFRAPGLKYLPLTELKKLEK